VKRVVAESGPDQGERKKLGGGKIGYGESMGFVHGKDTGLERTH